MTFKERIESGVFTFFDGAMGTMLQKEGLKAGEASETWNTAHPDTVRMIHKLYLEAGCNVVTANTFGCNPLKYDAVKMDELIRAAFENARSVINEQKDPSEKYIALDIGPLGKLLKPLGDILFEEAVVYFSSIVKTGVKYGADLILIETMTDLYETKAALLAAKESCSLPVIVSNAYEENGRLMTGAIPEAVIATLEGLHADAIGVNCSFGPEKLKPVIEKYLELSSVPVIVQPNAGMPEERDGKAYYSMKESEYAGFMQEFAEKGATLLGGCCGTEPGHIGEMIKACRSICPGRRNTVKKPVISSASQVIYPVMDQPLLIGERINPTGKKRMKEALRSNDFSYILSMAIEQQEAGAHVLDVNAGIPDIDETEMLPQIVSEVQAVCSLPLQIDSGNTDALEKALRVYNGKALVNSVNGTSASMEGVFPLIRKYGGMLIALTLDENGIPGTVQGRVDIALKITAEAEKYGISKNDLVFDPLTMAVSAGQNAAKVTLDTVRKLHEMGFYTSLGISNVSFGLPGRENINAAFFISAVQKGLTFGIVNPCSDRMMEAYRMACLLGGNDDNCIGYI
ncbi:MAG: homocysteine methyltransferase, partial [Clostridiales bacterium]|nr:homocysteine methyltransferase [Clostridiales bacterium]